MLRIHKSFLVFLILAPLCCISQITFHGKVYGRGKALKGVRVTALSGNKVVQRTRSNQSGSFTIQHGGKVEKIVFRKLGYLRSELFTGDDSVFSVQLSSLKKRTRWFSFSKKSKCPPSNPYCGCCFAKGTMILAGDGSEKRIETLQVGDVIQNVNIQHLTMEQDTITAIDSVMHNQMIELLLDNGTKICSTTDHPYYIPGKGWCSLEPGHTQMRYGIPSQFLHVQDKCIYYKEGKLMFSVIQEIRLFKKEVLTYNISGLRNHRNYFANGILVSNEQGDESVPKKISP